MPWRVAIPLPGLAWATGTPQGPLASEIGPYLAVGVAGGDLGGEVRWRGTGIVEPVIGVRLDLWGALVRVDLGWAPGSRAIGVS